jgi:hypothetical protein
MAPRRTSACSSASACDPTRNAEQLEEVARDPGDGARHRPEYRQGYDDRRRQDQRHTVGAQQGPGLGHTSAKITTMMPDRDRRIDDAGGAEQRGQHCRGQRRERSVDHVVAQQHGAHCLVLAVEQGVDDGPRACCLLGERCMRGRRRRR